MDNAIHTLPIPQTSTYREGFGVYVESVWSSDDRYRDSITDVETMIVRIAPDTIRVIGGFACVWTPTIGDVPVENFLEVDDLTVDDTHDLRCRWFATEDEARDHAKNVDRKWRNPAPWESFVIT